MIKTEMESMPAEMDEISRKIMQLEIEENALKKETDNLSAAHLAETQKELAALRANYAEMKSKWDNEKNSIGKVQKIREELEAVSYTHLFEKREKSEKVKFYFWQAALGRRLTNGKKTVTIISLLS